jgi:uncharacterized protein (DUF2252 family)
LERPEGVKLRISPATTIEERRAIGKAIRGEVPRTALAAFQPASARDPIAILESQAATRLPELNPIRYGRMAASPFAFFRGAAAVMADDFGNVVRSPIEVQLCGDAHLSNFGIFASPERRLVFDINDFDETQRGPFCWDLKRLAASIVIAGQDLGFTARQQENAVLSTLESYRDGINDFAAQRHLDVWYSHLAVEALATRVRRRVTEEQAAKVDRLLSRARRKDAFRAVKKLTVEVDGRLEFRDDPPLLTRMASITGSDPLYDEDEVERIVGSYHQSLSDDRKTMISQYRIVDFARKVVGVGSVGTRCFVALLVGINDQDPLLLQIKEAVPSVLSPYVGPSPYENQGRRVVEGQRMVQATPDIFLGWQQMVGVDGVNRDFYVRQLHDQKGSVELENLDPILMESYGRVCGWALARAQARSGYRFVLSGYLGKGNVFPETVAAFAFAYAAQNEQDHQRLLEAIDKGRVTSEAGL